MTDTPERGQGRLERVEKVCPGCGRTFWLWSNTKRWPHHYTTGNVLRDPLCPKADARIEEP